MPPKYEFCHNQSHRVNPYNNVADWDSMGRVVTQTRGRAF